LIQDNKKLYVIISSVTFDIFRIQRVHHLARYLSKKNEVLFIEPSPSNHKEVFEIWSPLKGYYNKISKFKFKHYFNRTIIGDLYTNYKEIMLGSKILKKIKSYKNKEKIIIFEFPSYVNLIKKLKKEGCRIISDIVDDYENFKNVSKPNIENIPKLVKNSDKVIVTSDELECKFLKINENIRIIRNGFEPDNFKARKTTKKKIAGYVGTIDTWFDFELVKKIAKRGYSVQIIGEKNGYKNSKNIMFLGKVKYSNIVEEIAKFKIC
jgi:hypothetical protein